MATKKKLLQAAAGSGGSTAWTLDNPTIPYFGQFYLGVQDTVPNDVFFKPDGLKMYIPGSSEDSVHEYNLSTAWDISTASFVQSFSVAAQDTSPQEVFFKPDGLKMYIMGNSSDSVLEYNLSTAWDISTSSYVQGFSVAAQDTSPTSLFFKPDGLKMYVVGDAGNNVNEYDLSTAWDISTASFVQSFSVAAQDISPTSLFFKPDGLKMYITGNSSDSVLEYNLSTAWDISTSSFVQSFSVAAQETSPRSVFFKADGLKMYVVGTDGDNIYSYTLSTAWDVSTASWDEPAGSYFSVHSQEGNPGQVFFKPDGLKMYVVGYGSDSVHEYNLSTAWDVSTASYVQGFSVSAQDGVPTTIFFKPDGTKMYVAGYINNNVYEYTLSTAWDVSTASFVQSFSVQNEDNFVSGLYFKDDGTEMYISGSSSDAVWKYSLSTAWDISTASIGAYGKFYVYAQEQNPRGVTFKDDGTKMYVVGTTSDTVYEYNLSTAWDVSTASYVQGFSVSAQDSAPREVVFKPDGTKMYVVGSTGDAVYEYNLSTAWNVSTASHIQSFVVSAQDTSPFGLFFRSDGLKMYIAGGANDSVYEYTLSTAWDISSASYIQNFSVAAQEDLLESVFFKPDGLKMYVLGNRNDTVYEYTLSTAWDVSTASYSSQGFNIGPQEATPTNIYFKSDGTKMYITGTVNDSVFSYTLSTAWDVSTASFDEPVGAYFSTYNEDTSPQEVFFKPDGTKMYVLGPASENVNEYDLSTAWNISTASFVQSFNIANSDSNATGLSFKDDGTVMYIIGRNSDAVWAYSLI